jgi:transcriptional regulator with XRE-family HTH domain
MAVSTLDIKKIKESLGLSQADLAQILGISRVSLSRLENGKTSPRGEVQSKLEVLHYLLASASPKSVDEFRASLSDPRAKMGLMSFMPCLMNFLPKSNLGEFLKVINFDEWLATALSSTIEALHMVKDIVAKDRHHKNSGAFFY